MKSSGPILTSPSNGWSSALIMISTSTIIPESDAWIKRNCSDGVHGVFMALRELSLP
ncbi:MAG: hypothetical protein HGB20_01155 [Chlorobiaceae bacterium]|nr:hypothetical protein [Chlorobiaceae bacterium]